MYTQMDDHKSKIMNCRLFNNTNNEIATTIVGAGGE